MMYAVLSTIEPATDSQMTEPLTTK